MNGAVLMLMLEPTPYILGFVREVKSFWIGTVEVAFVKRNLSQPWAECDVEDKVFAVGLISATRELWTCLKPGRYALVHLAGWSHPLIFMALMICALRGIPTAVESDTPYRAESTGWRPWVKRMLYPWLFRLPRLFLPGGSRQAAYFRNYRVPEERIRIAQMTVDIETIQAYQADLSTEQRKFIRERAGFSDAETVFLYAGRLERYKGILDLLDAYRVLKNRSNGANSVLLIVGDGTCRVAVDEAAGRLPGIVATGRLTGSDLFNTYIAADVLVLPSPADNWGLVVNEAMAFGLPVIVTDTVGCVDDLVEHGVTGLIIPSGDAAALAEAMQRLASDSELRHALGASARKRIRPWSLRNEAKRVTGGWQEVQRI
jgi:glycosyltransferase involved in cell wall biosynthesis